MFSYLDSNLFFNSCFSVLTFESRDSKHRRILSMMNEMGARYDDSWAVWSPLSYKIMLTMGEANCIWQHIPRQCVMNLETSIRTYQKEKQTQFH